MVTKADATVSDDNAAGTGAAATGDQHSDGDRPLVRVTEDALDVAEHLAAVEDERCGAVSTFIGQVRDHDPQVSGTVTGIAYSAHPDAQKVLEGIVAELTQPADGEGVVRIAASHRIGELEVGDLALLVCVATPHRAQAYEVSRTLVERIKVELPVWKKQHTADGASQWVGI